MKKDKKIFIDGGFHLGEGLNEFITLLNIDNDWEVHTFEPNPYCNTKIIDDSVNFHNKAIWVEDGVQKFNCEDNEASFSPKLNSISTLDGWGSALTTIECGFSFVKQIEVDAINFSNFISGLDSSNIYCKLDIEGAEFEVLRHLISSGEIKKFKELWVEFHERALPNETIETRDKLISEISKYTKINIWH
jgi:FkbM family methyltransferase